MLSSFTQSHPTLCDPVDCSTPGFPVDHQLLLMSLLKLTSIELVMSSKQIGSGQTGDSKSECQHFGNQRTKVDCNGSPPGWDPVPGILQARTLEWVAISFSNVWKWKVKEKSLGHVQLLATTWTAAHQAPPSMGFSRQEYWSGVPLPSPRNFIQSAKTRPGADCGVRQGCILSPCWFNLYSEYIMRNTGLDEAQAGIKIARRNIYNLRYADDTTLMAESEELKSLLVKVKEEIEKAGLKLNIQKPRSWHLVTSFHRWINNGSNERLYVFGLQNHCRWWLQPWN